MVFMELLSEGVLPFVESVSPASIECYTLQFKQLGP